MRNIRNFLLILFSALIALSCRQTNNNKTSKPSIEDTLILNEMKQQIKVDSIRLTMNFNPAFEEHAEITLTKYDSIKNINILIKNFHGINAPNDTFWFEKINLTNNQYQKLDSTLIEISKRKLSTRSSGVDGIRIISTLNQNGVITEINIWSPTKESDSLGYKFAVEAIQILKGTFNNTIIKQYFEDILGYIIVRPYKKPDKKRKIIQLRMRKYNWKLG